MAAVTQTELIADKAENRGCSNEGKIREQRVLRLKIKKYDSGIVNSAISQEVGNMSCDSTQDEVVQQAIPLTIPFVRDPRLMRLNELRNELRTRSLDDLGSKEVLCARLLHAMVNEGLCRIPDPLHMDDRQPEKWLLIANQQSELAEGMESQPNLRITAMEQVNIILGRDDVRTSREHLMLIATGLCPISEFDPQLNTNLHAVIARFAAALMIEPVTESELVAASMGQFGGVSAAHRAISGSRTIFGMCTGYTGIPEHLTEVAAASSEQRRRRRNFSNLNQTNSDTSTAKKGKYLVNVGGTEIVLGEEALFSVCEAEEYRNVLVYVARVECDMGDEEDYGVDVVDNVQAATLAVRQIIVVKPVSVQFGGRLVEFKLSLVEFLAAKKLYSDSLIGQMDALLP